MFLKDGKKYITWKDFELSIELTKPFIKENTHLVGILRGSMAQIQSLSNLYKLPYSLMKFSIYDGNDKYLTHLYDSETPNNCSFLIVDDIADSGTTINKTINYLKDNYPESEIMVYTLVGNKEKFPYFNYTFEHNNDWCVFPWEYSSLNNTCSNCYYGEQCNKDQNKEHCNKFNKSYNKEYYCKEFSPKINL